MDWTWYLFGFKGRINRAKYWLSALVLFGWMLLTGWIAYFSLLLVANGNLPAPATIHFGTGAIFDLFDPATFRMPTRADIIPIFVQIIATPMLIWIFLATSIKRLHDRDKSGWWMVPFFLYPSLYSHFQDRLPDSYALLPCALAAVVLPTWAFIELGFLKGSRASNLFGPNPLGKHQMRPRGNRDNAPRSAQGWDQQSEIEIVPHKAGPPAV
ncbi:DUF805 domain-containing protein [Bradyrhizobium jicamae]|uniref:DUF805 domain-containing protein n=1 Tax=Bradyrhizobium jicamae TaxID=280332 RepID=A0ABS5FC40_9BRAD|nr:DUF805 domain-containing protein [Bradyrhizobium jicamae]MBR0794366.1 DUF805 domain-containing protein [Bradyrhizobium jicamae]MBR0933516.1 DUF805 domain-containing protein [Bradyrhizobium jicamae]